MMRPESPAAKNILMAAVAQGISQERPWPGEPTSTATFQEVLQLATHHRVLGSLAQATTGGLLPTRPDQLEQLTKLHAGSHVHVLKLERQLLDVAAVFDASGIEMRVLKGMALAHLVYTDPSWRISADLDLLIPSDQFDEAVAIAIRHFGGVQAIPELRPGFDRAFGKESMVRVGRLELDFHRTFVSGPFGLTIDLDELFQQRTSFTVGDRTLLALGANHQFLHACYNTALGDYPVRLCSIRDLLLCRKYLEIDLDEILSIAERWRGLAVLQRAAHLVGEIAGADAAHCFAALARVSVPKRDTWLLRSYLTPARSYSRPLASLAVVRGVQPKLRYLRAIVSPSGTYLQSRGWTERSHLSRSLRRLRRHD